MFLAILHSRCVLKKDRTPNWALTKRPHKAPSQGIGRELEAFSHAPRVSSADPKRSEGSGRELEAFSHGPRVSSADPKRSEGSGRELEASSMLPLCSARTRNEVRVPCPDWGTHESGLTRRPHKGSGANLKHPACFHCVQREPEAQ